MDTDPPAIQVLAGASDGLVAEVVDQIDLAKMTPLRRHIGGRVTPSTDASDTAVLHQWPAVYVLARFGGDTVFLQFDDSVNRYRVTFGAPGSGAILVHRAGRATVRVGGLGAGPNLIRIDKISESSQPATLPNVFVAKTTDALPPPVPRPRRIEFVGDSDSVGYGNLSDTRDCQGDAVPFLTDTRAAFGPMVAARFDAEYRMLARSGIGVIRNYGEAGGGDTMLDLYTRTLFDTAPLARADDWQPQVVVLFLGSNDFADPFEASARWPDRSAFQVDFERRYTAFVSRLLDRSESAFFVLLATENYGNDYLTAHRNVHAALQKTQDTRIELVVLPEMDRTACHWHPSRGDHAMLAEGLVDVIENRVDVWGDASR